MSDLGPGEKPVNITGIISMVAYLVLLFCFLTYVMVKVWPHCQPDGSAASAQPTPPLSPAATGQPAAAVQPQPPLRLRCPEPAEVTFLWWGPTWIWWEVRLLLIVILSGALGSLVHTLRSIYWYVGNKSLKWSWLSMYVLLPFCGAALALVFYFVVRGGFFVPQGQAVAANPFGFAAISALIGMFSQQAVLKLKEVAETLLTKPKPGDDPKPQGSTPANPPPPETPPVVALKLESVTPNVGVQAGGETVEIVGAGFGPGVVVTFGTEAATVSTVEAAKLTVTTPAHAAATVDVAITKADKTEAKLAHGFTFS